MIVEVSIGEAVDKYSILELKIKKIDDLEKKIEIEKELVALNKCKEYISLYPFFYTLLIYVNELIWDKTNIVKQIKYTNSEFAVLTNEIFDLNQKRFRIKNWFNLLTTSNIKEQKSYATTYCEIIIDKENDIYEKNPEINYLLLEYDIVNFRTNVDLNKITHVFKNPNIITDNTINIIHQKNLVSLDNYTIPHEINRTIFTL
jgi:hypothetical protein